MTTDRCEHGRPTGACARCWRTTQFDHEGENVFHLGVEDPPGGTLDIHSDWPIPVAAAVGMTKALADLMKAQKIPHLVVRLERK